MALVASAIDFLGPHDELALGKPYSMRYDPPTDIPKTNTTLVPHIQHIEDVRGHESVLSVARNGFELLRIKSTLSYADFDDSAKVQKIYYKQVAEEAKKALGASRIQIFEHVLRKRDRHFPIATGEAYQFDQPTTQAHIDVTPAWAMAMAEHMNEELGRPLPSTNFKFINIWRPLRGPVKDWPLALCDVRTVKEQDIIPADLVYPATVVENCLMRSAPNQKWYFVSDQTEEEAWIFAQSDSKSDGPLAPSYTPAAQSLTNLEKA